MDKDSKNLYVFGYGLAVIIPFLMYWHSLHLGFSWAKLGLLLAIFITILFIVSKIAPLRPIYNLWIVVVQIGVILAKTESGWGVISGFLMVFACSILFLAIIEVQRIRPLFDIWMKVAHFIGTVITGVILTITYYTMFTFCAILLKILGKDLLHRKIDSNASSYWILRKESDFDKERCTKQF